jgi:hypothetical protein
MPTGAVLYQGHDSTENVWTWFDHAGVERGVLAPVRRGDRRNVPAGRSSSASLTLRRVPSGIGSHVFVGLDRALSRTRLNRAWTEQDDDRWHEDGVIRCSIGHRADGSVLMRTDSSNMFQPVARQLQTFYRLPSQHVVPFTDTLSDDDEEHGSDAQTAARFLDSLEAITGDQLDFFAYVAHGSADGLASAGIRLGAQATVSRFVSLLQRRMRSDGLILLYACLTGQDGGFAQRLSSLLPGMTVWGHNVSGQASRNPQKVRFRNGVREPIERIIGAVNVGRWTDRLNDDPDFYIRFAFLSEEQLLDELTTGTRHDPR